MTVMAKSREINSREDQGRVWVGMHKGEVYLFQTTTIRYYGSSGFRILWINLLKGSKEGLSKGFPTKLVNRFNSTQVFEVSMSYEMEDIRFEIWGYYGDNLVF